MNLLTQYRLPVICVLIDTWWNVNSFSSSNSSNAFFVLIDTWWNVNHTRTGSETESATGFNRYMVECESFHGANLEL